MLTYAWTPWKNTPETPPHGSMAASSKETWVPERFTFPCLLLYCLNYFLLCVLMLFLSFLRKKLTYTH